MTKVEVTPSLLVYLQDPGGSQYLLPVVKSLLTDGMILRVMAHENAKSVMVRWELEGEELARTLGPAPVSRETWKLWLRTQSITGILCSTSANWLDATNGNLIEAATELKIPVVAAMDHWKGEERFQRNGKNAWIPDLILCIDDHVRANLQTLGIAPEKIAVVGHPYLEYTAQALAPITEIRSCLMVSQPLHGDPDRKSVFALAANGQPLINTIHAAAITAGLNIEYRPHPKEAPMALPTGLQPSSRKDWNTCLSTYDLFIGVDSMAMVEAAVNGRPCLVLDLPLLGGCRMPPHWFPERITDIVRLNEVLKALVAGGPNRHAFSPNFSGSTAAALAATLTVLLH